MAAKKRERRKEKRCGLEGQKFQTTIRPRQVPQSTRSADTEVTEPDILAARRAEILVDVGVKYPGSGRALSRRNRLRADAEEDGLETGPSFYGSS